MYGPVDFDEAAKLIKCFSSECGKSSEMGRCFGTRNQYGQADVQEQIKLQ